VYLWLIYFASWFHFGFGFFVLQGKVVGMLSFTFHTNPGAAEVL